MTFIIAIQAKDSIVVVSDTSSFYITDDGRIKPHPHKRLPKLTLDSHQNVRTANGISQLSDMVFDTIASNQELHELRRQLAKVSDVYLAHFKNSPALVEQIQLTTIYCSLLLDTGPRLYSIHTDSIERFEDNSISVLSAKHADPTNILLELQQLQKSIKPVKEFVDELSCISHYLRLIKPIFKKPTLLVTAVWIFMYTLVHLLAIILNTFQTPTKLNPKGDHLW
ncbi:hypothetical protein [Moraxella bovis]|uniref:hypothetical protein n=1 Tax=Moraxella bovis TaxID=476 RepID=UPI002227C45A|nr:hypothetical protein [Moraxella bovis]UZA27724.1 hypothetical protein LP119_01710 [Moraxella bovis]